MRLPARVNPPAPQRGAALLILRSIFTMAVMFALVTGLNRSTASLARERDLKTNKALAEAKAALLTYAVTYGDDFTHANPIPGYLPCPELAATSNSEGVASSSCGVALVSQIGRFPWRSLGLGPLRDGSGECLWYAVSGTYKNSPNGVTTSATTSNMMNWDTTGQFAVKAADGSYIAGSAATTPDDSFAVAVIFAPGGALGTQDRSTPAAQRPPSASPTWVSACGGNYTAAAYLDTASGINNSTVSALASAVTTFIAGRASDSFNDKLMYITRADIWNAVKKRSDFTAGLRALTRRAAECIALYGTQNSSGLTDMRLPWASPTALTNYAINSRYNDANLDLSGRLSDRVDTSRTNNGTNAIPLTSGNYYLFTNNSYCSYQPYEQAWYENWKDHLFYALAWNYRPAAAKPTVACPACLKVNGAGNYAAVVMFAGEKLAGQTRTTAASKGAFSNYLEGRNLSNDPNSAGNSNYEASASATFNDIVYAIDSNLRVQCLSVASGTMVQAPVAQPGPPAPPGLPNLTPLPNPAYSVGPYAACP